MIPTNIHSPLNRLALDAFLNTAEGRARYDLAHARPATKKAEGQGRATRRTRVRTPARIYEATQAPAPVIIDDLVHRPLDPDTMRRLAERSGKEMR